MGSYPLQISPATWATLYDYAHLKHHSCIVVWKKETASLVISVFQNDKLLPEEPSGLVAEAFANYGEALAHAGYPSHTVKWPNE